MEKRVVLEELSGLRRIGGILDVPAGHELPKLVEWNGLTCQWVSTGPRAITYRELNPSSREGFPSGEKSTPTPESI